MSLSVVGAQVGTTKVKEAFDTVVSILNKLNKIDKKHSVPVDQIKEKIELKIKEGISDFSFRVADIFSMNTPIGSKARLINDQGYRQLYQLRQAQYGIPVDVGFHRGAYKYSEGSPADFVPSIVHSKIASQQVKEDAFANYSVGDSFYITATGPAFVAFQQWGGKYEVVAPSISQIMAIYSR